MYLQKSKQFKIKGVYINKKSVALKPSELNMAYRLLVVYV